MDTLAQTPQQLGAILRGYRKDRGLTQQHVAAQLGVAQKVISVAETHPERMPVARLFQLLNVLKLELTVRDRPSASAAEAEW